MTKEEFDGLAERVLLTLLAHPSSNGSADDAVTAVEIADTLIVMLNKRHYDLALKNKTLTPEEISFLHEKPHPGVIKAIKSVRDRTDMSLKDAKDLVDRARSELGLL